MLPSARLGTKGTLGEQAGLRSASPRGGRLGFFLLTEVLTAECRTSSRGSRPAVGLGKAGADEPSIHMRLIHSEIRQSTHSTGVQRMLLGPCQTPETRQCARRPPLWG